MTEPVRPRPPLTPPSGAALFVLAGIFLAGMTAYFRRTGFLSFGAAGDRGLQVVVELIALSAFLLAGWLAVQFYLMARQAVVTGLDQARSEARMAELLEQLVPALDRIAEALERAPAASPAAVADPSVAEDPAARDLAEVRRAVNDGRLSEAGDLAERFARDHPEAPEAATLAVEVEHQRRAVAADLRARIDAARSINDPSQVIEYRGQLAALLPSEEARTLDRELLRWLMGLIQKRLRTGTVRADVADLAGRIADAFPASVEGASLRASLPTLRRSAGLCPRCAQPYDGFEAACPRCLAAAVAAPPVAAVEHAQEESPENNAPHGDPAA